MRKYFSLRQSPTKNALSPSLLHQRDTCRYMFNTITGGKTSVDTKELCKIYNRNGMAVTISDVKRLHPRTPVTLAQVQSSDCETLRKYRAVLGKMKFDLR